jgi:REP element-mobilizing transposase RayT
MPRLPRVLAPGGTYHVTSRGNRRQSIFGDDYDRRLFLLILGDAAARHRWLCRAYCLLSNHFHLLVHTPEAEQDLPDGMHRLNGRYAQWFNDRHELSGHLFQGRFHSTLIEGEGHLLETVRYVYRNPVEAGLSAAPEDWAWSSYSATTGRAPAPAFLSDKLVLELFSADPSRARRHLAAFVGGSAQR